MPQGSNKKEERNKEIVRLWSEKKTFQEIGEAFGLTKQRAAQIVRKETGLGSMSQSGRYPKIDPVQKECPTCKKSFLYVPYPSAQPRKFCSRPCLRKTSKFTPEEKAKRKGEYGKKYYQQNKERFLRRNKARMKLLRQDPEKYKKHLKKQRDYMNARNARIRLQKNQNGGTV